MEIESVYPPFDEKSLIPQLKVVNSKYESQVNNPFSFAGKN
jgi:hypothetical protein